MDDDKARDVAKVSISLCLAGLAGTIPTLALILAFHHPSATKFLFLPLPLAVYVVVWLFVTGAMLSAHSFYFRNAMPAYIAYGLWTLGMYWLAISLGYTIAPANESLAFIALPVTAVVVITALFARRSHRAITQTSQDIKTLRAQLEALLSRLEESEAARTRPQGQPDNDHGRQAP